MLRASCPYLALIACLSLMPFDAVRAAAPLKSQQDGIVAQLELSQTEAVFSWRFTRRPPALVDRIEAAVDGHAIETSSPYEPFGASGEVASVTFLIDTGGLERVRGIEAAEEAILATVAALPRKAQARLATYNTDYHAIGLPSSAAELRSVAAPRDVASDLVLGLKGALSDAGTAARRAIYVYTDGFNPNVRNLAAVKALVLNGDVSVSFVLEPSMRLVDLASLEEFAKATGGRLMTRAEDVQTDIGSFLTSGASVRFPLDATRQFFWQSQAMLTVALWYGDRKLVVRHAFKAPVASLRETLGYVWQEGWLLPSGVAAAALLGLVPWWILRQRRKSRSVSSRSFP